ncbi:LPXTG cell wall anchor domain-containing protein, partial [Bacillus cereus]|uniref:LPXTG cell wall anchor domain-containing protein n=2 Tax=Bacillus TaxID=1386 RepID=UPI003012C3DD
GDNPTKPDGDNNGDNPTKPDGGNNGDNPTKPDGDNNGGNPTAPTTSTGDNQTGSERSGDTKVSEDKETNKVERDLPKTGADVFSTIGAGLAFIGAGVFMLFRRKKANR